MTAANTPFSTYRGYVSASECDQWGHQNTRFYLTKADEAQASLCSEIGLSPSWLSRCNAAMVLRRNRILFKRELRAGDAIDIRSGVREARGSSLRFFHLLYKTPDTESALFECEAGLIDVGSDAPIELPRAVTSRAAELFVSDATLPQPAPLRFPRPPTVTPSQAILSHSGTIEPWEHDDAGLTPPQFLIPRFSGAMTQVLAHLGLSRAKLLSRHIGCAALDSAFEHPMLLRPGQSIEIRTGILDVGRKVLRVYHHVTDTASGNIAMMMEVVAVFFDLRTRKSLPMPAEIASRAKAVVLR